MNLQAICDSYDIYQYNQALYHYINLYYTIFEDNYTLKDFEAIKLAESE